MKNIKYILLFLILLSIIILSCKEDDLLTGIGASKLLIEAGLIEPINNEIVDVNTIFIWHKVANSKLYKIYISEDSMFSNIKINNELSDTIAVISGLDWEKTYYWRVVSLRNDNYATYSEIKKFITKKIKLNYPRDNALNIPSKPFLGWNNCEGATSYSLFVSTDNEFKNIECQKNNIYQIYFGDKYLLYPLDFHLEPNKKYYWAIHAYLANGDSVIYHAWSFTTMPFYASGTVSITAKGKHYIAAGDSTVITDIIGGGVSVTYSPYFLSFIDNVYHMYDGFSGNNAYNRSADINFADGCTKINSGTFNIYSRSIGGANGMTYSGWRFEIKDIPFIYENENVFRYMVTGEDCAKYFVKYESSWLDWNGKGGQYLESKWDKDSYIMIEFKK
jgi:hypothetical protein